MNSQVFWFHFDYVSSPTSSQTMSDHSPWGLVPWLEGQTALPLQAEGSARSPGLWPTNHPDQEGSGRGEATGEATAEASDLQFSCFFISFSDLFPGSGCVWMIFAMSSSVWAQRSSRQLPPCNWCQFLPLEVVNFGHVSTQICARHGANDVQPALIQEVLAGLENCARLCLSGHSYQSLCWIWMCLECAWDAKIAGQFSGSRFTKVHWSFIQIA